MDSRKLIYIGISIVCIVAIISAIFMQFSLKSSNNRDNKPANSSQTEEITQEELKKNFAHLFDNTVDYNNYDTSKIKKLDDSKDIIYTAYENETTEKDKYELDVHIPVVNIAGDVAAKFNNTTQKIFADKTTEVLNNTKEYTIYSITYTGYVNGDILSIIIKSTLKEGANAQRTIVETYNYNLATGNEVNIYNAIEEKGISTNELTNKINIEITKAIKEANKIQLTGYETYTRDLNSDIYQTDNITTFFIGPDGKLYVIFAYGNNNFTSEMDIIEF